jgi:hypothetical protein
LIVMTDGTAWLAEPQSIAHGGYSVVIAPDLESESLARRIAETARGPYRPRPVGELTGRQVQDLLEGLYGEVREGIALRHGELDEWSYVIKYGGWQGEFGYGGRPVDRGGLHVFHLEYEEENGKPVPPRFTYRHDENLMCTFNLHLDGSWAHGSPEGDPEVAAAVRNGSPPPDCPTTTWTGVPCTGPAWRSSSGTSASPCPANGSWRTPCRHSC